MKRREGLSISGLTHGVAPPGLADLEADDVVKIERQKAILTAQSALDLRAPAMIVYFTIAE
jgi:hypothetical protein